jgi:hypothetical protein
VAAVAAAWWAIPFFGLVDLSVPFVGGAEFYDGYLLETGWGLCTPSSSPPPCWRWPLGRRQACPCCS